MNVVRTHHVGITVASREEATASLRRLGFTLDLEVEATGEDVARGNGLPSAEMNVAFLSSPVATVELIEHRKPGSTRPRRSGEPGFAGLWLAPTDVADVDIEALAVDVHRLDAGSLAVDWTSPDPQRTAAMLSRFGLEPSAVGDGFRCRRDDLVVNLEPAAEVAPPPRPNDLGRVHLCFQVEDVMEAHRELVAAGVAFHSEPFLHAESGLRWVFAQDPGGVGEVELIELPGL